MAGSNHIDNAARNRGIVLSMIRERGPLSRLEISSSCALSATTVKRIVEELLATAIVKEASIEPNRHRPGRRSALLDIRGEHACAVGFTITPGGLEMAVVDLRGRLLGRDSFSSLEMTPEVVASKMAEQVHRWEASPPSRFGGRLLGIGIGVAGLVDAARGLVHFCPNLRGWENVALAELVSRLTGRRVVVDEEVRCMALAETRQGASRGETTSLFVYVGRGVGAGIVLDGRLHRGRNGMAGEFGHITVKPDGPLCNCGNRGCLEAVASVDGILAAAEELRAADVFTTLRSVPDPSAPLRLEDLSTAASSGDKAAAMVVEEVGSYIGTGIADLLNVLDPGLLVLGGEVVEAFGDLLLEPIRRTVGLRAIPSITRQTRIVRAEARDAATVGAATLLVEHFFESQILNV